jgi:hypothetical protein
LKNAQDPATSSYSSNDWADTVELGGIFDDDVANSMADYNKVYVKSCHGDAFFSAFREMGEQDPFFAGDFFMKGYGSIYSLFDVLAGRYQLGAWGAGEDIVLGGYGEGAIGMLHSIEIDELPLPDLIQAAVGANA